MPCRLPSRADLRTARRSSTWPPSIVVAIAGRSLTTTTTTTSTTQQRRPLAAAAPAAPAAPAPRRTRPHISRSYLTHQPQPIPFRPRAYYHSYDHPPPPGPFNSTERALLAAAYAHVPAHGFSHAALVLGARDAGYLDISTNLLPDSVFTLVRWHLVSQREALTGRAAKLFASGVEHVGVGRKVETLTWERLMRNRPVIGRWQEALAIMAQPTYVPESLKELARLSDEIWFLAGDTSVDPSWYTKRASLSAIYAPTELFMTTDKSEGFIETSKFLRRRLAEVQDVGGMLRSLGQWAGFTASAGLNVLRSKGARI